MYSLHNLWNKTREPAGLSFGKAVAAMLALKERSAPGCAGRDPMLRRQRELLLNIRLADVFGMQVSAQRESRLHCLLAGNGHVQDTTNLRCIGQRAIAAPQPLPCCARTLRCSKADTQQVHAASIAPPRCRQVKAVEYGRGDVRAVEGCQAIDAAKVDDYLARAFDGRLRDAEAALAVRCPPAELALSSAGPGPCCLSRLPRLLQVAWFRVLVIILSSTPEGAAPCGAACLPSAVTGVAVLLALRGVSLGLFPSAARDRTLPATWA